MFGVGTPSCVCGIELDPDVSAIIVEADVCAPRRVFAVQRDAASLGCDGGCFGVGEELPAISYTETALGEGRLRPLWLTRDDELLLPGLFRDVELEASCFVASPDEAGVLRCLPADGLNGTWRSLYADDACDQRLGAANDSSCDVPLTYRISGSHDVTRLAAIGAPPTGALFNGLGPPGEDPVVCLAAEAAPTMLYEETPLTDDAIADVVEVTP